MRCPWFNFCEARYPKMGLRTSVFLSNDLPVEVKKFCESYTEYHVLIPFDMRLYQFNDLPKYL